MPNDEIMDSEIEALEEELKKLEDKDTGYGSPSASQKDNMFRFFKHILTMKDTTRVGNLAERELGVAKLGVRHYQEIANYAGVEGLHQVEDYFINRANIMTATSMSRTGFWSKLFVTQIKKEQKIKEPEKGKKRWFGGKEKTEEESE